jgi:hypothetical protein
MRRLVIQAAAASSGVVTKSMEIFSPFFFTLRMNVPNESLP